jgi:cell division septum initiation protein DivIVA
MSELGPAIERASSIEGPRRQPDTPQQRLAAARSWARRTDPAEALELGVPAGLANERMQALIGAAERAAEAIRRDAEQQAQQHLAEAQRKADRLTTERVRMLARLTDELIEHTAAVQQRSAQILTALDRATAGLERRLAGESRALSPGSAQPSSTSLEAAR